jgi:hypothetical protein
MPSPYPVLGRQTDVLQRRLSGNWGHTYFRAMSLLFLWLGFMASVAKRAQESSKINILPPVDELGIENLFL